MRNNKKYHFEKSIYIKCSVEALFNFHLDTNNLPKISPSFPKASIKKISDIPLKRGSTVTVALNFIVFKNEWEILIEEVIENKLIGDLQKRGVFEYWYHSHIFDVEDDHVLMTDKIEFIPPFGIFGRLFLPIIRFQLKQMFKYRQRKTKMIFEN